MTTGNTTKNNVTFLATTVVNNISAVHRRDAGLTLFAVCDIKLGGLDEQAIDDQLRAGGSFVAFGVVYRWKTTLAPASAPSMIQENKCAVERECSAGNVNYRHQCNELWHATLSAAPRRTIRYDSGRKLRYIQVMG